MRLTWGLAARVMVAWLLLLMVGDIVEPNTEA
jgi:hypothetical protein